MKQDARFAIANREAIYGIGLAVINFLWWYGFAYGLGSKPQEEYTYIAGFPAWFFYSCIGGFILMVLLVIFVVKVLLVDVPFDDEEGGQS